MLGFPYLPFTTRKMTRWWIFSWLLTFMLPTQATQEEEILKKAFKATLKHYERAYKIQNYHLSSFGDDCVEDTLQSEKDARFLYDRCCKNGVHAQETTFEVETFIKKIMEHDHEYVQSILSQNPERRKPPKKPLREALRIRLLIITLQRNLSEQKAQPAQHPFWEHRIHTKTHGFGLVDYHNLPGLRKGILGIQSEQHPKLDEVASTEVLARLRNGAVLFLENNPETLEKFKKTKEYAQDGKNTRYILTRHFNSERTDPSKIIACDYRYEEEFLTKVVSPSSQSFKDFFSSQQKNWPMLHLVYYPHAFKKFYQLKVKEILDLNKEAAKSLEELTGAGHRFPQKRRFHAFYQEVRKVLLERAQQNLKEMRAIDDLLEEKKDLSIEKILGEHVLFRRNGREFLNSFLELRLHDLMFKELAKDLDGQKGIVNAKLGAEHGFRQHKAMMDVLQSDDQILKMTDHWMDEHRTPVQRRYFLYRIQKMMDEGRITKLMVHTSENKKIKVVSIIKPQIFNGEGAAVLETQQEPYGVATMTMPYNKMTDLYVEEVSTHGKNYIAPALLTLTSMGIALKKYRQNTQEGSEGLSENTTM